MKRLLFFVIIILFPCMLLAQESRDLSRKDIRIAKRNKIKKKVKNTLESDKINFVVRTANPLVGPSISLTTDYEIEIKSDSVFSALPYFGTAYQADYGSRDGGINFKDLIYNYQLSFNKKTSYYEISFQVIKPADTFKITLSISTTGYGVLKINSIKREPISYNGIISTLLE